MKSIFRYIIYCSFILLVNCIKEIPLETQTSFNKILVIEATLTNKFKSQTIKLSRSFKLETNGPSPVSSASVKVIDELGNVFLFIETDLGTYRSLQEFAVVPNINYSLEVIDNGITYLSSQESFLQPTEIDELVTLRGFNENNKEGVSILVNSFDSTGNSKFYRFTYEETYKIIAPRYSPVDLMPGTYELIPKEEQQQICYATDISNSIIQETTTSFDEDRLNNFKVHFINRDNAIISHRYSILITQHVQSAKGYQFYKTLNQLSSEEELFSQLQQGFLEGNIFSITNPKEQVLGYFEVCAIDTKRLFFNYDDLFPDEDLPPYFISCTEIAPLPGPPLDSSLNQGFKYYRDNEFPVDDEGPYFLVPPACGNCTVLGSTSIPDFWMK